VEGVKLTAEGDWGSTVVLEVLAHTREVLDNLDSDGLEVRGRGNTAALENLGGVDGTGGENNLSLGTDRLDVTAGDGAVLDGGNLLGLVDHEASDLVLGQKVEVGASRGDVGVVANTGMRTLYRLRVLGSRDPANTMLVTVGAVLGGVETKLDPGIPADLYKADFLC